MSSTTRPSRNGELDAYYTPDPVARACVATLGNLSGVSCWEPHAGGGAFVRALVAANARTHWSDADPAAPVYGIGMEYLRGHVSSGHEPHDAIRGWPWTMRDPPAWIVGNPPYNDAQAHVVMAIHTATAGVGFLLRIGFLEGQKRAAFWRVYPAAEVHVLTARPSFTGGGTDSAAYGWFVWRKGHSGATTLHHLDWRARG